MAKIDPAILSSAGDALIAGNVHAAILACKSGGKELFNEEGEAEILKLILTRTPKALADCPPRYLPPIRVAAALMELLGLGVKSIRDFITVEPDYNYRRSPEAVGFMLCSHAGYLRELSQMADVGITKVRVIGSGLPKQCAACRKANGKVYLIREVPELPHMDCSCSDYCHCTLGATR